MIALKLNNTKVNFNARGSHIGCPLLFSKAMKQVFVFLFLVMCMSAKADKVYDFNSTCQQAYKEIIQLKINNGLALIDKAKKQNADNLIPYLLESYADFFVLFLNEDQAEYKIRKPKFDERITLLKQGPESSPLHRYCLAMLYVHKAAVEIKFGEMWNASWNFKRAYQYIKDNKKSFATFAPNDFLYGSLEAVVGTIPKGYKWITNLLGMKGSVTSGMKTVEGFINSSDPWARLLNNEGAFIYCYLRFYLENEKEETLKFIQTKKLDLVNNHLLAYMAANLALNNKQTELAKLIVQNRNKSNDYLQTGVWDFEMGFIKLYHLETNEAITYFEKYLNEFKGKFYVKDIYQKLSWAYYLNGNMEAAKAARNNILTKGATDADADKQALKDAKKNMWPEPILLRARLLNDGGYNTEALQLLAGKKKESFNKEEEKLEYIYRLARINDDLNKDDEALKYYNEAIGIGEFRTEYFAARAALQAGMIYEKKGDKTNAVNYYNKCLNMENHDYKNSLDQKAKSGIARCKGQ
jgi:hypothetical protein